VRRRGRAADSLHNDTPVDMWLNMSTTILLQQRIPTPRTRAQASKHAAQLVASVCSAKAGARGVPCRGGDGPCRKQEEERRDRLTEVVVLSAKARPPVTRLCAGALELSGAALEQRSATPPGSFGVSCRRDASLHHTKYVFSGRPSYEFS
jgi:hypothetical protein